MADTSTSEGWLRGVARDINNCKCRRRVIIQLARLNARSANNRRQAYN